MLESKSANSISVAIVCYHTPKVELALLLDSLLAALRNVQSLMSGLSASIYFIDNSEETTLNFEFLDEYKSRFTAEGIELRVIHGHGNIGYGSAHNIAIDKTDASYHLLMNPDVVLDETSLFRGIEYLAANDKVIIISPSAADPAGNKQYLCKRYPSLFTFFVRGFIPGFMKGLFRNRLDRFEMRELSESKPGQDIPIVSGCFMLCKTPALKELNGFDEKYFLYFEDFDLSMRATKIGRLDYLPSMKIIHGGGNAARKGFSHLAMFTRSAWRFFGTHGWKVFRQ
ncbi:MAG: glycosyltransferase [Gammaproteobacteria bacterium]|nr:glycosyltransferase [Gammaproteobacteria bacterium]